MALIHVGGGATNEIYEVFAFIGCDAIYTTVDSNGNLEPAGFIVGASTQYAFGLACTPEGFVQRESWFVGRGDDWENEPVSMLDGTKHSGEG